MTIPELILPDLGAGIVDVLRDTKVHPKVGCSLFFSSGMKLKVFSPNGGKNLGTITVKSVCVDRIGRNTGRLEFNEPLPTGSETGCFLVYDGHL